MCTTVWSSHVFRQNCAERVSILHETFLFMIQRDRQTRSTSIMLDLKFVTPEMAVTWNIFQPLPPKANRLVCSSHRNKSAICVVAWTQVHSWDSRQCWLIWWQEGAGADGLLISMEEEAIKLMPNKVKLKWKITFWSFSITCFSPI